MAGNSHQNHYYPPPQLLSFDAGVAPSAPPRRGRGAGIGGGGAGAGAIVAVQGGHIVRSTGRKDRHSKVCTAKGPRDRRVRLSAHTAIQFYDVQDRLGYDRPSKAVDWLMKNAKDAIDKLAELPPWQPSATPPGASNAVTVVGDSNGGECSHGLQQLAAGGAYDFTSTAFLPPSMDSDAIADTIKSFFPVAVSSADAGPSVAYHNYTPDLLSRAGSHHQELRLSLHSFQEPIFHHQHHHSEGSTLGFNATPGSFVAPWNVTDTGMVNSGAPAPPEQLQSVIGHGQLFHQRGTLQSSTRSLRGWVAEPAVREDDNPMHPGSYPVAMPSIAYASSSGFHGFRIPTRIKSNGGHDDGITIAEKPPSASSDSFH